MKTKKQVVHNAQSMMTYQKGLHRFAKFTSIATFFLLCAGALVTSTGSGLAVPDWPLSYGQFFPPMIGGILFEHGHRMIATCVGFLALVQAVWFVLREPRKWVRSIAIGALGVVVVQGLLGGLTVILLLPDAISISHAGLAEIFFCLTVSLSLFTSKSWCNEFAYSEAKLNLENFSDNRIYLPSRAVLTTLMIYIQILLGAFFRHSGQGLWMHVIGAVGVVVVVLSLARLILKDFSADKRFVKLCFFLIGFLMVQLLLGLGSYISKVMTQDFVQPQAIKIILTSTHLAFGALMLATSLVLTLWSYRSRYEAIHGRISVDSSPGTGSPVLAKERTHGYRNSTYECESVELQEFGFSKRASSALPQRIDVSL